MQPYVTDRAAVRRSEGDRPAAKVVRLGMQQNVLTRPRIYRESRCTTGCTTGLRYRAALDDAAAFRSDTKGAITHCRGADIHITVVDEEDVIGAAVVQAHRPGEVVG